MWKEKYWQFTHGVNLDEISTARQLFFKTNPTSDQIMLLDMHEQNMNVGYVFVCFVLFIFGGIIGGFLAKLLLTGGI